MGILFGREKRAAQHFFPEPVIPPYPGANVFGQVSVATKPDSALQVPTVWACVSLLANAVSMLPLETFRLVDNVPIRLPDPPLLVEPSDGMTQSEWLHMLMVSLLLRGNAFGLVEGTDRRGFPAQITLQSPDDVDVKVDKISHTVSYAVNNVPVDPMNMWHVRGLTLPGHPMGLSPIAYAAAVIGLDLAGRKFASDFLAEGGVPKAVLQSDNAINQEQARTIKERLLAATRKREVAVLGAGLKYTPIQIKPEESQFLATQQANVAQIARYFGVPAGLVGGAEGGSMTYTNVEQRSLDFLTYGVSFWLKRIEDAVYPLLPGSQHVRFNTSALLRTDAETQATVAVQYVAAKVLAPTEIRAALHRPPMTEAQKEEVDMVPLTVNPTGKPKAVKSPNGDKIGNPAPTPADDQGVDDG